MRTERIIRHVLTTTKRAALAALLCGTTISSLSGDVVDLATTSIDRQGNAVAAPAKQAAAVRQVQAQVPAPIQPPAPIRPPTPPAPIQPPGQAQIPAPIQPPGQAAPGQLNVDPNAGINDIQVPQAPAPAAPPQNFSTGRQSGLGATAGSFSSAPTILGDFAGGGLAQISGIDQRTFEFHAPGFYISGTPGSETGTISFEVPPGAITNDVLTTGLGLDLAGSDGQFDTFSILEPVPPTDAPTSPGQGFLFDGGTAVFTGTTGPTTAQPGLINDGDQWYLSYSYSQEIGTGPGVGPPIPVPSPGVSVRRVKISENFSPEVRDRFFLNYSFFNDAFGNLGDISRYVGGFERVVYDNLISVEARFPFAGTLGSTQVLGALQDRAFEFGNPTLIGKGILLRTDKYIWSAGLGLGLPLADDTVLRSAGRDVVRIKNESLFIQPFMGLLYRKSRDTSFQGYMQLDVAANGDPVFANLTGGAGLPQVGVFNDSTLMHIDVAASQSLYRNRCAKCLREVLANAEIHYTGTLQDSDFIEGNNFTYTNLKRHFTIVNATFGMHMVLANNMVVSPAMAVPLRTGLDEQFDYEALLQVNYFR